MGDSDGLPLPLNHYVGIHFRPTDQHLLQYLHCKIIGLPYYEGAVLDCDLYGDKEPWEIWESFKGEDGKDLYFFTKLKRSTNEFGCSSEHVDRKIGLAGGTWSDENKVNAITETDGEIIGYVKHFRYENDRLSHHNVKWIMHEYDLLEDFKKRGIDPNYVLCRMRKIKITKRRLAKRIELQQSNVSDVSYMPHSIADENISHDTTDCVTVIEEATK